MVVPANEGLVNRKEVMQMIENAVNELADNLDAHVAQVTDNSLIRIVQRIDAGHCMTFVRGLLRRATCFTLTSILIDEED